LPAQISIRSASANGFARFGEPTGLPMYSASEAFEASSKSVTELWCQGIVMAYNVVGNLRQLCTPLSGKVAKY
jgi:hypothetical protein